MGLKLSSSMMPVARKSRRSASQEVLVVRRRPNVVHGGGFVVTDCRQEIIFKVDGCGILGREGNMILRDSDEDELLVIRKKGGITQALNLVHKKWEGHHLGHGGSQHLAFTLKDPKPSCLAEDCSIRITSYASSANPKQYLEVKGDFRNRDCTIVDSFGNIIAQVGADEELVGSRDVYYVEIKPGVDQVFVFGVIATLDYIHGGSTRCEADAGRTQRG